MAPLVVALSGHACAKTVPATAVAPPAATSTGHDEPTQYRIVNDAEIGPASDRFVVGQVRGVGEPASTAWVARVTIDGRRVWAWEGKGPWEIAEHVAVDRDGTLVVSGRSSPLEGGDSIWVRRFEPDGSEVWLAQVAKNAVTMALGSWDGSAFVVTVPFGAVHAEVHEIVADGKVAKIADVPQARGLLGGYGYPVAERAFAFDDGMFLVQEDPTFWSVENEAPQRWGEDWEARDAAVKYPPQLDVPAPIGRLDTKPQAYAELRWWFEAGRKHPWPSEDPSMVAALSVLGAGGGYCDPAPYERACGETQTTDPPEYPDLFSDPCSRGLFLELLARASPVVRNQLVPALVPSLARLPVDDPVVDLVFDSAVTVGVENVARTALENEALQDSAIELLGDHPAILEKIEREFRGDADCELVGGLRDALVAAGVTPEPWGSFEDACDQLYAMCADGTDDRVFMPKRGRYRVNTSCEDDYPTGDNTGVESCEDGTVWSRDVLVLANPDAVARCSDGAVTSDPVDLAGNCGVLFRHDDETITFRKTRKGTFVIDEVDRSASVESS